MNFPDDKGDRESPGLHEAAGSVRYVIIAFLVALALLNAQVTVTRLLAYRFFYHFVFFVISLAQLGLAAAGAWIYASGHVTWRQKDLVRSLLAMAALTLGVLAAYSWSGPPPNLSFGKLDGPVAYPYLTLLAVLLVGLNFAGGMALTMLFTTFKERMSRLYAADLAGASAGCLVSVAAMMVAGPVRALLVSGVAALASALLIATMKRARPQALHVRAGRAANGALYALSGLILFLLVHGLARPGQFDPWVLFPGISSRIIRSEWTHLARTDADRAGRYVIDGDASTDVDDGGEEPPAPEYELVAATPDVAIIGVGAGPQLRVALARDAASVLAVDINPTIIRWSRQDDRSYNGGIFHHPTVRVVVGEGRHVLRSSARDYDLIVMHAIDTWTASAQGAYSLTENYLYTSEAMRDMLSKLEPGGVVSIRRWLFWPPRENLRLFTTILDALQRSGVGEPERHVIVLSPQADFRNPELKVWGFVFASNRPFGPEQIARLDAYVNERGWSWLYRPDRMEPTPFTEYVHAPDRDAFLAAYPWIVTPARDANPFFFQFAMPWSTWGSDPGQRLSQAIYSGSSSLLLLCLAVATVLTVLLLGTPLFLRRRDIAAERQLAPSVFYFGALGLGFMAFELPAIQIMTLFLGHPTYALSVVLLGLLAAAGVGSMLMGRAPDSAGRGAILCVIALAIGSGLGLLPAVHALIHVSDAARFTITLAYVVLIGIPLGMPFVAGVRLLGAERPHHVAWAWAVNGAAAVVGSSLLMILMVYHGSGAAFAVAALAYGVAFIARSRLAVTRTARI